LGGGRGVSCDTTDTTLPPPLAMHEYPLSMVDHLGFRQFVSGLNPDFETISRSTLRIEILKMFDNGKSTLKKSIEVNQGKVAITIDLLTASNQKRGYTTMSAHFVDDDWILQNHTLRYYCNIFMFIYVYLYTYLVYAINLIMFDN